MWAKIVVDGTLFVASYVIQERWVFRDQTLTEARRSSRQPRPLGREES